MPQFWNWYKNLFANSDDKTILAAISATFTVVTFIFNFILKSLFKSNIVAEFFKLSLLFLIRFWYVAVIVVAGSIILNETTGFLGNYLSIRFVSILIALLFVFNWLTSTIISGINKKSRPKINIYGCFSINDNSKINIDTAAEELNQIIKSTINSQSKHYSFRNNFVKVDFKEFSKIVPLFLGYKRLNLKIKNGALNGPNAASLHFVRNKVEDKLTIVMFYNEKNLANPEPIEAAEKFLNNLAFSSKLRNEQIVEVSVKIYFMLFGISHLDVLLDQKEYNKVHYVLDSSDRLMMEIKNDLVDSSGKVKEKIQQFLNFWLSTLERYRALAFLEQTEYPAAIKHIFQAIVLNPHFPYDSYEVLVSNYTKRYGIELLPSLTGAQEYLELPVSNQLENLRIVAELGLQVKFKDATYHYDIVHEIIRRSSTLQTIELIEKSLGQLDSNLPFIVLTKSEILKHLEKGTEKINEIYLERFDECINNLRLTLTLDPKFILVHMKLGILLMLKGHHYNNDKIIEEGVKEYAKGMHVMTQLGFRIR